MKDGPVYGHLSSTLGQPRKKESGCTCQNMRCRQAREHGAASASSVHRMPLYVDRARRILVLSRTPPSPVHACSSCRGHDVEGFSFFLNSTELREKSEKERIEKLISESLFSFPRISCAKNKKQKKQETQRPKNRRSNNYQQHTKKDSTQRRRSPKRSVHASHPHA